jgi:RecA/RadA recombinase
LSVSLTHQQLIDFANKVQNHYKEPLVGLADQIGTGDVPRLSTGSVALDYVLGGGAPRGQPIAFLGAKSSGKTTNLLRCVAAHQKVCRRCWRPVTSLDVIEFKDEDKVPNGPTHYVDAYCDCVKTGVFVPPREWDGKNQESEADYKERIAQLSKGSLDEGAGSYLEPIALYLDVEGVLDIAWARRLGVDTRRLWIVRPSSAEQAIDMVDTALQQGVFDLVVIDSIAAMTPNDEREASTMEWQRGLQARLINKMMRKIVSSVNQAGAKTGMPPTVLWINQERDKMEASHNGPKKVSPGGRAQGFAACIELECWASDMEKESFSPTGAKTDEMEYVPSLVMNFKTKKNKTAPVGRQSFYQMCLKEGHQGYKLGEIMEHNFMFNAALRFNIIQKDPNGLVTPMGKFLTQKALKEKLRENGPLYKWLYNQLIAKLSEVA